MILLRLSSPSVRLHPYRLSLEDPFRGVRSCSLCGSRVTHTAENVKIMLVFCFQGALLSTALTVEKELIGRFSYNPKKLLLLYPAIFLKKVPKFLNFISLHKRCIVILFMISFVLSTTISHTFSGKCNHFFKIIFRRSETIKNLSIIRSRESLKRNPVRKESPAFVPQLYEIRTCGLSYRTQKKCKRIVGVQLLSLQISDFRYIKPF